MKKALKRLVATAIVVALLGLTLSLTSCSGGLSGTYVSTGNAFNSAQFNNEPIVSIEFKSFGNAEIITSGWITTTYVDASYKVNGDSITLKAEWDYSGKWEGTYTFSQSGNIIYIDGFEYLK